ncbi:unnamed protein product [Rhizophagus irregularis]|nr:unnamed protein product [Rhizophagus irregularis]
MGKKRHEGCRDHKLSVFFGGKNTKELKGIKSKDVKGWLKNRFLTILYISERILIGGMDLCTSKMMMIKLDFTIIIHKTNHYNPGTAALSQPSPQSSPLQLPPPQSPQSSPVQLPPPQSPQPSQSQLPAYNIFEVEINITITSLQYF